MRYVHWGALAVSAALFVGYLAWDRGGRTPGPGAAEPAPRGLLPQETLPLSPPAASPEPPPLPPVERAVEVVPTRVTWRADVENFSTRGMSSADVQRQFFGDMFDVLQAEFASIGGNFLLPEGSTGCVRADGTGSVGDLDYLLSRLPDEFERNVLDPALPSSQFRWIERDVARRGIHPGNAAQTAMDMFLDHGTLPGQGHNETVAALAAQLEPWCATLAELLGKLRHQAAVAGKADLRNVDRHREPELGYLFVGPCFARRAPAASRRRSSLAEGDAWFLEQHMSPRGPAETLSAVYNLYLPDDPACARTIQEIEQHLVWALEERTRLVAQLAR